MFLYALTLQRPTAITSVIHGNFSGSKTQEILLARGRLLELYRLDVNTGKLYPLLAVEVFGIIRSLAPFRLTGATKDFIILGSDSGRIIIMEYNPIKNTFDKVHQETFGKSGCRRIVPGQYLAVDPKGRAVMIGAVEKQKLVYILNRIAANFVRILRYPNRGFLIHTWLTNIPAVARDSSARLTISSPLEAHKSYAILFHMVGVDVGFENPTFACLELDYEDADQDSTGEALKQAQQTLTYYELDLGLNHVVRKFSEPLDHICNILISVPGGIEGPSGVMLCAENFVIYKNVGEQGDIKMPIPRRVNDLDNPDRGIIFVCSATHKTKTMFFVLAQTEQGDVFKITLQVEDEVVTEIRVKYFDTIPVAVSMTVLKTGFLFVGAEFGNHTLYQIAHLGDNDDELEFSSLNLPPPGESFLYSPRVLKNLVLVDELESLAPITSCIITDLVGEDTPQFYALCGRGPRSTLKILRHGLEVTEMAVSELPGNPVSVWTAKTNVIAEFDAYIIVSFINATLVLSIGETVEEVTDSGFLGTTPTINCCQLGEDTLVQVYPEGIRHIRSDKRVNEWRAPHKKLITRCAVNERQVVIALTGGELVYFEMNQTGQLNEYTEKKEMGEDVLSIALGPVPPGELRSRFLAVGLRDETVRIISLDPSDCLQPLALQALPEAPDSLAIVEMGGTEAGEGVPSTRGRLYLYIGLRNGVLLRTELDMVTGELSDTRTRYLGSKPAKLFVVKTHGTQSILAISSRSWLSYTYQSRFHLTPLSYEALEYASGFSSEQCPEGLVAISSNSLRILALQKLGTNFNQASIPLQYTPRRFCIHPPSSRFIIIETDHNAFTDQTKRQRKQKIAEEIVQTASNEDQATARTNAEAFLLENTPENIFGAPKAGTAQWASTIRLLDPIEKNTINLIRLEQNESAMSLVCCQFMNQPVDDWFLVVGITANFKLNPREVSGGAIDVYRINQDAESFNFLHRTTVDEIPAAICAFQGKLLVGIGKTLRLYELGKRKLLRKAENKHIPSFIVDIKVKGHRIFVSDVQHSMHFLRFKPMENSIGIFADDTIHRWITTSCLLDYRSIAVGDKFGNISVLQLAENVNDDVKEDPTGIRGLWDRGLLSGASQKAEVICNYHIGETVMSLEKTVLIPGGPEALVFTTLSGTIGMLVPFTSKEDIDFFQHLEMHLRQEYQTLSGRDHLTFRSYYFPVKNVIDGDLCEQFNTIDPMKRSSIAEELDRTATEVSKKLEDIRTRYAF